MSFKGRDVIKIKDFSKEELEFIVEETEKTKNIIKSRSGEEYNKYKKLLKDNLLISIFVEDSTRTRTSFDQAMTQLGGKVTGLNGREGSSLNKHESIKHTLQMFKGYGGNAAVIRHNLEGTPQFLADTFDIPIINAGDGKNEHPTQAMLDIYTIKETQKRLDGLNILMIGDLKYGRTTHSLVNALSKFQGNKFFFASPEFLSMPEKYLNIIKSRNSEYKNTTDIREFIDAADIIYVTRVQQERLPEELKANYDKIKRDFQLRLEHLVNAKENMKIMHPLPIDKQVMEISPEVENNKHAHYFTQAENGLYTRMTLLGLVLGKIDSPIFGIDKKVIEATNFEEVEIHPKKDHKKIDYITNGIVIDHLPPEGAVELYHMMNYNSLGSVFMATNIKSNKYGLKSMIKIESESMTLDDLESLNKVALKFPEATINLVKDSIIIRKGKVRLPSEINGMIRCTNGSCISRPEHNESVNPKFYVVSKGPDISLECHYCQTTFGKKDLYFV